MVLKTQRGSELPQGAVKLSKEEALKIQWNFIKGWPSEVEVLTIKFGRHIVAATTLFSSVYVINFLKNFLNINKTRFILALSPGALMPSVGSFYSTDKIITNPTLLMKLNCPLCDQMKFALLQFYLSLVFPACYGYLGLVSYAAISQSYAVPSIRSQPREFWKLTFDIFKQGSTHFKVVGLVQSALILFLPYLQNKQLCKVMIKSQQENIEEVNNELPYGF